MINVNKLLILKTPVNILIKYNFLFRLKAIYLFNLCKWYFVKNNMKLNRISTLLLLLAFIPAIFSFQVKYKSVYVAENAGVFKCFINDKAHEITGQKGYLREITGGKSQLSIYNNLFYKFSFFNPEIKSIELSPKDTRDAIIRYIEPGTNNIYYPVSGRVILKELDLENHRVSGEFEMELSMPEGKGKVIRITRGQFLNIPIETIK
jgi:hypothetical protein